MRNSENLISGTVIVKAEHAALLNWTKSATQPMIISPRANAIIYGNRSVYERAGKYYVKSRAKLELEVTKIGENKYEVRV